MERLPGHSPDLVEQNIAKLKELFPSVVTEGVDESGRPVENIDFDALRQELSDHVVEGPEERFQLDWPGKRRAALAANAPVAKTLRPQREESVDFDTTRNLFIEGDNLDVLKLLQESYLGKVKLIYIDPPYNTGNDFIYNDNFAESKREYLERSGQVDEAGNRLVPNTEANGRFHSDWLSMMYPRLKLARNLLREDGIIFVSIDDNEASNTRRLLNEVFGESNYFAELVVIRAEGGGLAKRVVKGHEYLIAYTRSDKHFRGLYRKKDIRGEVVVIDGREYWIETDWLRREFGKYGTLPYEEVLSVKGQEKLDEINRGLKDGRYRLIEKNGINIVGRLRAVDEDGSKFYSVVKHLSKDGSADLDALNMKGLFSNPKPVSLLNELIMGVTRFSREEDDVILDFFIGSGTTAQAVLEANVSDGGSRRYIGVQLPEVVGEDSLGGEAGFGTIADLARERIRQAAAKIVAEAGLQGQGLDVGFRALRVDSSGRTDVFATADDTSQESLDMFASNIASDRSGEDLLFQVLLEWGLELSLPIERSEVDGHEVFDVNEGALVACFDTELSDGVIEALAQKQPLRIVFRDDAFADDAARINAEQTIQQIAPDTEVRVL